MTATMCQSELFHGFALHRDRELSDNLLQTADDLDQLHASRARDAIGGDAFCGWIPDPRAPQRRGKDTGKPPPKRLRSTKERRFSQQNLRAATYEFRHYRDIGRYIQQYRRDHACTIAPRDTNPEFTSDALVALLRKADPQRPYLIPRSRSQDFQVGSLEPPKLGVLRRAVTGTARDWHSVSRPVTEEAPTSHSPPQLSQQIPVRGPDRGVTGLGDHGVAGCPLHTTSQSRPSSGTTESRDSGSSANSNPKNAQNHGTLTLSFNLTGSNSRQQQQQAAATTNRPARPQYTSIVRSEPCGDARGGDVTSVSDMTATGVNIMAMDRQWSEVWQPPAPLPAVPAPRSRSVPVPYRVPKQIHPRLRFAIESNRRRTTPLHLAPLSPRVHPSVAAQEMLDPKLRVLRGFAPKTVPNGMQDFLEHLENFTWREKLKLLSLQEQRPLGSWFRPRGPQTKAPDMPRENTPEKNKRRAQRNSQRFKCLALDPDNPVVFDHWEGDRHKKEMHAQLNQKSLGVVLFKKSLLPERDIRKRLLFNAKGGGWKTYAASSSVKTGSREWGFQTPDDVVSTVTDVRDTKRLTDMMAIKAPKEQVKTPGKTTPP